MLAQTYTLEQAISRLQSLHPDVQQQIFRYIDFMQQDTQLISKQTSLSKRQQDFLAWREHYAQSFDDDELWQDWANVRDKSETGREFSWDD